MLTFVFRAMLVRFYNSNGLLKSWKPIVGTTLVTGHAWGRVGVLDDAPSHRRIIITFLIEKILGA
jgi:hypothetical protein